MKMKKKMMLLLALLLTIFPTLQAKTALMIVAHGSPMESWRKPVLDLEPLVKQQVATGKLKGIDIVKVALMEYTEPSVASMVKACEAEGADTIFALPIFIAPIFLATNIILMCVRNWPKRILKWFIQRHQSSLVQPSIIAMCWRIACLIASKPYRRMMQTRL